MFHSVCVCIVVQLLEHFVEEYFDQNPISQLGIMFTNCKRAEKVTELGGNGLKTHLITINVFTSTAVSDWNVKILIS